MQCKKKKKILIMLNNNVQSLQQIAYNKIFQTEPKIEATAY